MNHNGVISLPAATATTYAMGDLIAVNGSGEAILNNGTNPIGVVLHDVDSAETNAPVDIQLISAGGIALCKTLTANAITVGQVVGSSSGSVVRSGGTNAVGIALEASANGDEDIIKVIL
jgi:predicted RecA/RadA family phage recombinase